jgi:hypothetical protein
MRATVAAAGRSPTTQSLLRANGRSKPKRMAARLEDCMLTIISYSSVVLPVDRILSVLPCGEELMPGIITYTRARADIAQR